MERRLRRSKIVITLTPEIIRNQPITRSQKVQQLISIAPLRPARQTSRSLIRIHSIEEADIVLLNALARKIGCDTVRSQDIRRVESTENRSAVIVRCEV